MATQMTTQLLAPAVLLLALSLSVPAHAGRSCDARKPEAATITQGLTLAEKTHLALEAEHARSGTQVVVLARAGQDLTRWGLRYSHLGLAYREARGAEGAAWRVVHKLNHCGTDVAAVYRQGLGEFFLDDLWRFDAAWVVPTPAVQQALLPVLQDPVRAARLHHRPYNLVSYAWGQRYQQSNQWALETLASAMVPQAVRREQAQGWLRLQQYEPTALKIGALTRLGGRATSANIAFDDHPNEKRFSDRIETVTVDSVFAWLQRAGLGAAPATVRID